MNQIFKRPNTEFKNLTRPSKHQLPTHFPVDVSNKTQYNNTIHHRGAKWPSNDSNKRMHNCTQQWLTTPRAGPKAFSRPCFWCRSRWLRHAQSADVLHPAGTRLGDFNPVPGFGVTVNLALFSMDMDESQMWVLTRSKNEKNNGFFAMSIGFFFDVGSGSVSLLCRFCAFLSLGIWLGWCFSFMDVVAL